MKRISQSNRIPKRHLEDEQGNRVSAVSGKASLSETPTNNLRTVHAFLLETQNAIQAPFLQITLGFCRDSISFVFFCTSTTVGTMDAHSLRRHLPIIGVSNCDLWRSRTNSFDLPTEKPLRSSIAHAHASMPASPSVGTEAASSILTSFHLQESRNT